MTTATEEAPTTGAPPWEVIESPAAAANGPTLSLEVFNSIEHTLAAIEARHKNVVYDLTTTKGNDEARKARKELVSIRTTADEVYETWNRPLLDAQKDARALRDGFKKRVELIEKPLDEAIKADETRRANEKKAKEEAEAKRLKAIRDRIAEIYAQPAACVGVPADAIEAAINVSIPMLLGDKTFFEELLAEAEAAVDVVTTKLNAMLVNAREAEAKAEAQRLEAKRLADERAELERQRAALAAQLEAARKEAALADAARKAEGVRLEQERQAAARQAADQAEKIRLAEEAAERQRQAEAQARLDAIAAAERAAAERIAEQQRQLAARQAAFEATQAAAKPTLEKTETKTDSGATVVVYRPALEQSAPPVEEEAQVVSPTTQVDAFAEERAAEAERVAALPKVKPQRPTDKQLTEAVSKAFDADAETAAEWLGTYDVFEEIARIQGVEA